MKLLLVDDDEVDRLTVKRALAAQGGRFDLVEVSDTRQAEAELALQKFDLILLDQYLASENGIDWLRHLRSGIYADIAVIIISSEEDEALGGRCVEAGAQDFLPKNEITPGRLVRALAQARIRFKLEGELKRSHELLRGLAEQDSLTQLANRYFFEENLRNAIARCERSNERIALILFDLDNFKEINDSYGHDAGDGILREVADRLRQAARKGDMLFRLGGDEFAILPQPVESLGVISRLAERVRKQLLAPIRFDNLELKISASIGIATCPDSGETADELYKAADIAMYRAKNDGRNRVCFYSTELQAEMEHRLRVESELVDAISGGQIQLYYQPQIDCHSQQLASLEVLVRWQHPTEGLKTPECFLSVVEQTGQIKQLGGWILREACSTAMHFNHQQQAPVSVAVNISAVQLHDDGLVEQVEQALAESGLPADLLELELTETALLEESDNARHVFGQLVEQGVHIVLDNFGIGHSSLAHLRDFPIDILKIDKSFLWAAMQTEKTRSLLRGVIAMAKTMQLHVVIEGVEKMEQQQLCYELGVERMQGYHFERPLQFDEMMAKYNRRQVG